jgi:hypothetical protein
MLPEDFNPVGFLYLNPELSIDLEEAAEAYINSTNELHYSLRGLVPDNFDADMFLSCHAGGVLDISNLNQHIGRTESWRPSRLVKTIMKRAEAKTPCKDNMRIRFTDEHFQFGPSFISADDRIVVETENAGFSFTLVVDSVDYASKTLYGRVDERHAEDICGMEHNILVVGHWLYDPERLARINLIRGNAPMLAMKSDFNPELYRLLYPDVRHMTTSTELYFDYLTRSNAGEVRVSDMSEIVSTCSTAAPKKSAILEDEDSVSILKRVSIVPPHDPPIAFEVNGAIKARDYLIASDIRLKTDVEPLTPEWCTALLKSTEPVKFNYIDCEAGAKHFGFVANDLATLDPILVSTSEGYLPDIMKEIEIGKWGDVALECHCLRENDRVLLRVGKPPQNKPVTVRKVVDKNKFVIGDMSVSNLKAVLVGHHAPDILSVNQGSLVGVVVGALKDIEHRLAQLESRFACLGLL